MRLSTQGRTLDLPLANQASAPYCKSFVRPAKSSRIVIDTSPRPLRHRRKESQNKQHTHSAYTHQSVMDTSISNPFSTSSSDPKTAVMNQIRQEAAVTNARQLIEVRFFLHPPRSPLLPLPLQTPPNLSLHGLALTCLTETQRTLFREMRPYAGPLAQPERRIVLYDVHGEVYGGVEYGVEAVRGPDTEGEWRGRGHGGSGEPFVMRLLG